MTEKILRIPNMNCGGCQTSIEDAVAALPDAAIVEVDLKDKRVSVSYTRDETLPAITSVIEGLGFTVEKVTG
jgi:copper chaperone CopZ